MDDFAVDHPQCAVSLLRYCNVVGPDITTPLAEGPGPTAGPAILGFDPRCQVVHEDDVVRADPARARPAGAGHLQRGGRRHLPWSEVAAMAGSGRTRPAGGGHGLPTRR